jgi:hypothetical protein
MMSEVREIEAARNDYNEDSSEISQDMISIEFSERFTG